MSQIAMKVVELGKMDVVLEKPCQSCMELGDTNENHQHLVTFVQNDGKLVGIVLECVDCNEMHGYALTPIEPVFYDMELVFGDNIIAKYDDTSKTYVEED